MPITRDAARAFVRSVHRHLPAPPGDVFRLAVADEGVVVGVAIVGRPVARLFCDGRTLEVNRVATLGTRNANSMLYRGCWRVAKALGYRRIITYTLPEESGASLRGAGWIFDGLTRGGEWSRPSRARAAAVLTTHKLRWSLSCAHDIDSPSTPLSTG